MGKNMNEDIERRDYFAAHAMQGILSGRSNVAFESISGLAYYIADSMMIERISEKYLDNED
jgi:hypothetical protein